MTGLDTNVILRFIVRDDDRQAQIVHRRFRRAEQEGERLFVSMPVLLETIWVLETGYGLSRGEILHAISLLRGMPIIQFEADGAVQEFLAVAKTSGAELSDLLIANLAREAGCVEMLTFDKRAARTGFFRLLA